MREYDFIVLGTGISGLSFALKAAAHGRVAVLTKRSPEVSNTAWAQGGICCVADPQDSFNAHIADTVDAGAGLCEEAVVNTIVRSAPAAIEEMIAQGVNFDREPNGSFSLGREGGHTQRRILHARDTTGREISEKLLSAARREENIEILDNHFAIDLVTTAKLGFKGENRIVGLYALDEANDKIDRKSVV